MEPIFWISLLAAISITSFLWFIYASFLKSKLNVLKGEYDHLNGNIDTEVTLRTDKLFAHLHERIIQLRNEVTDTRVSAFNQGYARARSEFSIKVFPYKEEHLEGSEGIFINDLEHQVVLGYQYQLFVNGIPVLAPAVVIEQELSSRQKKVDIRRINAVLSVIKEKLLPIIAESNGLIQLFPDKNDG